MPSAVGSALRFAGLPGLPGLAGLPRIASLHCDHSFVLFPAPLPPPDCGMVTFSTPQLQQIVKEKLGESRREGRIFFSLRPKQGWRGGRRWSAAGQAGVLPALLRSPVKLCKVGPELLVSTPPLQAGTEDHTHYHEFSDLEQSVRDDVKLLRESNL